MKPSYSEQDVYERLRHFERRYGMSSEDFIRLYESSARVAGAWVYLTVPRYRLVRVDDAFIWAGLCHRLGIGGGD